MEAFCAMLSNAEPERQLLMQKLHLRADILQSLPRLNTLSGRSKILIGLKEGKNGWEKLSRDSDRKGEAWSHVCSYSPCVLKYQTLE